MSEVIKLKSVNKQIIWGGTKLSTEYGKSDHCEAIAEAWELTIHPEGISLIDGGKNDGKPISDIFGKENFPIMIKLIDAEDNLSVQVHPAKTEMWYIADCKPGAQLVYGLKDKFNKDEFAQAVANGKVEKLLNYVPVKKGDVFFIPQGLVHAIGKGITIAEIQQNSNVTYRIYDYNRLQNGKPRQLHVAESIETIKDFDTKAIDKIRFENRKLSNDNISNCRYFSVDVIDINGEKEIKSDDMFLSVICIEGNGYIGRRKMSKGDSFILLPNSKTKIKGNAKIILTKP